MTEQRQAELISAACKEIGLNGHIRWIEKAKDAQTWAERLAERFRGRRNLPVKNSYMMCDTLDMCFFYDEQERPVMTYAGHATTASSDLNEGKLVKAFENSRRLLAAMKRLQEDKK